jgi:hypothetical protein
MNNCYKAKKKNVRTLPSIRRSEEKNAAGIYNRILLDTFGGNFFRYCSASSLILFLPRLNVVKVYAHVDGENEIYI